MENILSKINEAVLTGWFDFLPEGATEWVVTILGMFTGKGWHLTLGGQRIARVFGIGKKRNQTAESDSAATK